MTQRLTDVEFAVLRGTIAWRGTVRMAIVPITTLGWASLALVLLLADAFPLSALFPLFVLVGGFEAIHALHVGTERIGRYLQVQYEEESDGPRWETTALSVGPALPGGGIDPLFSTVFAGATLLNLLPAFVPGPATAEAWVIGLLHAAFAFRIVRARRAATRQRALELESFKAVLARERNRH